MARYDGIAEFYDAAVAGAVMDVASVALLDLAGDVRGSGLVDIACGHGRITRELARRGADVVGVDISDGLLAKAVAAERSDPLGISYVRADVTAADSLFGMACEGAVCNYGLSDIDDLDGALATVSRVLEPACSRSCTRAFRAGTTTHRAAGLTRAGITRKAGGWRRTRACAGRSARTTGRSPPI